MVQSLANFPREEMTMFTGHSSERIKPVFGIIPESFDLVEVVSSLRSSSFFPNHHMVPLDVQRTTRMPVIGVVKTSRPGVTALFTSSHSQAK
jgi:hypothetical protein